MIVGVIAGMNKKTEDLVKSFKLQCFNPCIYNCHIYPVFSKNWKDIARKIIKDRHNDSADDLNCDAATIIGNSYEYFMFFDEDVELGVICHECMHVLMNLFNDFSLKFDFDNQEVAAYLLEFIIRHTMRIKSQKITYGSKKKITNKK